MRNRTRVMTGCLVLGAAGAIALWAVERQPSDEDAYAKQVAAAMEETAAILRDNLASPTEPAAFERTVLAMWPHLHPELANVERERDPEYLAQRAAALEAGLNARQLAAERMKDPAFAARRQAAEAALREGLVDPRVAEEHVIRQAEIVRARERAKRAEKAHADGSLQ